MITFFKLIIYTPLLYALTWLYGTAAFHDLGVAIVLLTLGIRGLLYPLFYKSFINQTLMQRLQPHIEKIQLDHKNNKEQQAQALMKLYKDHNVNPFAGILLLLVQLPILISLFYVFRFPPAELSPLSLGLIDLAKPSIIIAVLAAITQFFQGRASLPKNTGGQKSSATQMARQMVYMTPGITLLVLWQLPSAVGLYWLISSIFSWVQQLYINRQIEKKYPLPENQNHADSNFHNSKHS